MKDQLQNAGFNANEVSEGAIDELHSDIFTFISKEFAPIIRFKVKENSDNLYTLRHVEADLAHDLSKGRVERNLPNHLAWSFVKFAIGCMMQAKRELGEGNTGKARAALERAFRRTISGKHGSWADSQLDSVIDRYTRGNIAERLHEDLQKAPEGADMNDAENTLTAMAMLKDSFARQDIDELDFAEKMLFCEVQLSMDPSGVFLFPAQRGIYAKMADNRKKALEKKRAKRREAKKRRQERNKKLKNLVGKQFGGQKTNEAKVEKQSKPAEKPAEKAEKPKAAPANSATEAETVEAMCARVGLNAKIQGSLEETGKSVPELTAMSVDDLTAIPNVGPASAKKIASA
jgi:hypothetical protein